MALIVVCAAGCFAQTERKPSLVYSCRTENGGDGYEQNFAAIRESVDRLVIAVSGKANLAEGWRVFVAPTDRVGIKISTAGGGIFSTHRAIVDAIAAGLRLAGVPEKNIVVWDRDEADLARAGYRSGHGFEVRGIPPVDGYDPEAFYTTAVLGKLIWGDVSFRRRNDHALRSDVGDPQLSSASHLSLMVTHGVDKIINVPRLTVDENFGLAGAIYNVTLPNVDNWRRLDASPESLAELYADARIARKVVLHVMDGLVAQYAAGPNSEPNYAFPFSTIYASRDPVALDSTVLNEIESWRKQAGLPSIAGKTSYLPAAERLGLGNFNREKIEVKPISR
jgi:uncharacterized protein (DUF362 family)